MPPIPPNRAEVKEPLKGGRAPQPLPPRTRAGGRQATPALTAAAQGRPAAAPRTRAESRSPAAGGRPTVQRTHASRPPRRIEPGRGVEEALAPSVQPLRPRRPPLCGGPGAIDGSRGSHGDGDKEEGRAC